MMKFKLNLPLSLGLLFLFAILTLSQFISIPDILHYALVFLALALELWGIILLARSPEMKNSKLRQWKLRMIGRGVDRRRHGDAG